MTPPPKPERCDLCGREVGQRTRHHLIPRTRHASRRTRKRFDRQELHQRIAMLCRPCHKMVHATLGEKELESHYNTLEAIAAHPDIARFLDWLRRRRTAADVRVYRKRQ